jgi:putative flippase GtrA
VTGRNEIGRTVGQFIKFAIVGLVGLAFASAVLYAARRPFGLYGAGLLAYAATPTLTWALNRVWTFDHDESRPAHQQWALFVIVNTGGFALNWGTYALLVTLVRICAEIPLLALAAGSAAGALANFALCRAVVFSGSADPVAAEGAGRRSLSRPGDE